MYQRSYYREYYHLFRFGASEVFSINTMYLMYDMQCKRVHVVYICSLDPVTEWTEWSTCDVTCGSGVKTRSREATRELSQFEEKKYDLEVSAECIFDPCEDGEHMQVN